MSAFRYWAVQLDGAAVEGVVEASDRKAALQALGRRGLYPSKLELAGAGPAAGRATPGSNHGNGTGPRRARAESGGMSAPTPGRDGASKLESQAPVEKRNTTRTARRLVSAGRPEAGSAATVGWTPEKSG